MTQQKIKEVIDKEIEFSKLHSGKRVFIINEDKLTKEIYKLHLQKLDSILTLLETAYWEDDGSSFITEITKYQNEVELELDKFNYDERTDTK